MPNPQAGMHGPTPNLELPMRGGMPNPQAGMHGPTPNFELLGEGCMPNPQVRMNEQYHLPGARVHALPRSWDARPNVTE